MDVSLEEGLALVRRTPPWATMSNTSWDSFLETLDQWQKLLLIYMSSPPRVNVILSTGRRPQRSSQSLGSQMRVWVDELSELTPGTTSLPTETWKVLSSFSTNSVSSVPERG